MEWIFMSDQLHLLVEEWSKIIFYCMSLNKHKADYCIKINIRIQLQCWETTFFSLLTVMLALQWMPMADGATKKKKGWELMWLNVHQETITIVIYSPAGDLMCTEYSSSHRVIPTEWRAALKLLFSQIAKPLCERKLQRSFPMLK